MRVVLFGAGASTGSCDVVPRAPPLGSQLYGELKEAFPNVWGSLPAFYDSAFCSNFERGMQLMHDADDPNLPILMKQMAMYFAQFGINPSNSNLYVLLLSRIKNPEEILYSSLNYDLLFEIAAQVNRLVVSWFQEDDAPESRFVTFNKLHGSCNFKLKGIATNRNAVTIPVRGIIDGPLEAMSSQEVFRYCQSNEAVYPSMCFYMPSKRVQFGGSRIGNMQRSWRNNVLAADKVLVIGANPNPDDVHIWEPLAATKATLGFVGSRAGFESWVKNRGTKDTHFMGQRWQDSFDSSIKFLNQ